MPVRLPMVARDPHEATRASTPLELFFDLTFVVAIAQAASSLHHGLVDGYGRASIAAYVATFLAIWWAWMNFTWFASAYDNDDAPYRLAVFAQMVGVLVLAAGVSRAFTDEDLGVMIAGYVIMRLAMVSLWLRAAAGHPERRSTALRYAIGIATAQLFWVARLALPDNITVIGFLLFAICEMAVPVWAERAGPTPWHPEHIAERYGLFTIIVLGESILSATIGVQAALDASGTLAELGTVIAGGLLIVFALWWVYFDQPTATLLDATHAERELRPAGVFLWGYAHYVIFGSVAAAGAGLAVAIDQSTGHSLLTDTQASLAVTVPVSLYLLVVWLLHRRHDSRRRWQNIAVPLVVAAVVTTSLTTISALLTGLIVAAYAAALALTADASTADDRSARPTRSGSGV